MPAVLFRAMSRFTIANLPRIEVAALSDQLLAVQAADNSIAVVDVRDSGAFLHGVPDVAVPNLTDSLAASTDHIGGHIKGSKWVPSHQFAAQLPTLLRQLRDTHTVVFHCALSKQRGPSAALQYIRAREEQLGPASVLAPGAPHDAVRDSAAAANTEHDSTGNDMITKQDKAPRSQKVCVLRGGFSKWQEAHGPDERLTEAYVKDLWEDY